MMTDTEKDLETPPAGSVTTIEVLTPEDEALVKQAWRKVDLHIIPVAVLLYLSSYIDRANIGNARVFGMEKDLGLTSNQYNWAVSIFFIGYLAYETPSNILLKLVHPRYYIPILTLVWGTLCCLVAVVKNYSGLLAIRFFLGIAEGGFLPGIVYWMGCWYPREMQGRRYSVLYSSVSLTGAFGGLLATAINTLNGGHGIAGWRWIFIVEGSVTAGLGLIGFFVMCNYPDTAPWLTKAERVIIIRANEADRALNASEAFDRKQIWSAFKDYRTYLWGTLYLCNYIPVYSVILSLPSVIQGLGYRGTTATLMACPPYGFGFIIILIAGYTSDKYKDRFWHYIVGAVLAMVALIVLMTVKSNPVRYFAFFIMMFMFIPISVLWCWVANNIAGTNKRAAASGVIFSMGNIGGAIAGQIYRSEWAPRFVQGHAINFGCYVAAVIGATVLYLDLKRDNERRDRMAVELEGGVKEDLRGTELGDLGDRHPDFRYYL